jgi:hypothetical protein
MPFAPDVAEDLLVQAARCCCLCRQFKGQKVEVHHIQPEAQGGPSTPDNGIVLCFDCHAEVESYNDKHPRGRKYRHSELKRLRDEWFKLVAGGKVGGQGAAVPKDDDLDLVRFYSQCLDRPAFQDEIQQECSIEDFDKAIEDTITAINTGCLRARDGQVLAMSRGKSFLANETWRQAMDTIVDMLRALRSAYTHGVGTDKIYLGQEQSNGQRFYIFRDHELARWFDATRAEIMRVFGDLCNEAGIPTLQFPRRGHRGHC